MSGSASLIFKKEPNKDKTHAIRLQIIMNRTIKVYTLANIHKQLWDDNKKRVKKAHPDHVQLNAFIYDKVNIALDLIKENGTGKSVMTIEQIMAVIKGKDFRNESFFDFLSEYIEQHYSRNDHNGASAYTGRGKSIWSFVNQGAVFPAELARQNTEPGHCLFRYKAGADLFFDQIDLRFLINLETFLIQKGLGKRSVFNYKLLIRTLYNRAIKSGLVSQEKYPFKDVRMKMPKSEKIPLGENEIKQFESAVLCERTDTWKHAQNAWIFSLAFGGMRVSDVLTIRWDMFKDGRLYYIMRKNNSPQGIKIHKRATAVLDFYEPCRNDNAGYVFPEMAKANLADPIDVKRKLKNAVRIYNKWLKKLAQAAGINKNLSMHISRHSFGNLAAKGGIPTATLQKIYDHKDPSTTAAYQQYWETQKQVDAGVETVLDF